jgi:hypothetical protein
VRCRRSRSRRRSSCSHRRNLFEGPSVRSRSETKRSGCSACGGCGASGGGLDVVAGRREETSRLARRVFALAQLCRGKRQAAPHRRRGRRRGSRTIAIRLMDGGRWTARGGRKRRRHCVRIGPQQWRGQQPRVSASHARVRGRHRPTRGGRRCGRGGRGGGGRRGFEPTEAFGELCAQAFAALEAIAPARHFNCACGRRDRQHTGRRKGKRRAQQHRCVCDHSGVRNDVNDELEPVCRSRVNDDNDAHAHAQKTECQGMRGLLLAEKATPNTERVRAGPAVPGCGTDR